MNVHGKGESYLSVQSVSGRSGVVEYGCTMYDMNRYIIAIDYTILVSIYHIILCYTCLVILYRICAYASDVANEVIW